MLRSLSMLVIMTAVVRLFGVHWELQKMSICRPTELRGGRVAAARLPADSESVLALGRRLPFEEIGEWELQLLPRISDTLSGRIMDERERIRANASTLPEAEQYSALEIVRGIGPQGAQRLGRSIRLWQPEPSG